MMNRIPTNSFLMKNLLLNALQRKNTPKSVQTVKPALLNQASKSPDQKILGPGIHPGPYPRTDLYIDKSGATIIYGTGGYDRLVKKGTIDEDGYIRSLEAYVAYGMAEERDQKNAELSAALAVKGIELTDKDVFTLTVNFDNTVTVSGHADEARGKEIERALNDSAFNFSLAQHIRTVGNQFQTFTQCTYTEFVKYSTNNNLLKFTEYSINQLTVRDDGVFTDDGKNIQELFYNAVAGLRPHDPEYAGQYTAAIMRMIRLVESGGGIQNVREASYSIEYRNNSLCDIGTPFGFGADQREWYDKLLSIKGAENQMSYSASIGLLPPWRMPASTAADYHNNSLNDVNTLFEFDSDQRDWFSELLSILGTEGWKSYATLVGLLLPDNASYSYSLDIKA